MSLPATAVTINSDGGGLPYYAHMSKLLLGGDAVWVKDKLK